MATPSLDELTCCSICLETFTRPKALPCQHTYCYRCLLSIGKDRTKITCPQCREEHDIPEKGIAEFRDNTLANNLIELCHAQRYFLCTDCEFATAILPCDHCNQMVCASCFSTHVNLSVELRMTLKEVKEIISIVKSEVSKEKLERSKQECSKHLEEFKAFRRQKLRELFQGSNRLEKFMGMVNRVQNDLLRASDDAEDCDDSYFTYLTSKAHYCAKVESLKRLLNDVCDLKTALRLLREPDKSLQFVPNTGQLEYGSIGRLEIGQTVVEVQGCYDSGTSAEELLEFFATTSKVDPTQYDLPSKMQRVDSSGGMKPPVVRTYRQNQLPSNVNYADMGLGCVTVVGQGDQADNRLDPVGAAYHVSSGDIYVADKYNNRIMVYPSDGSKPRVFYTVTCPFDVAISSDGKYIYIAAQGLLIKVDLDGCNVATIHKCSLGPLGDCFAVVCHDEFTVLLDRDLRCVIVLDESCKELRCFGQEKIRDMTAVAISINGEMFVTDNTDHNIEIFSWNGEFLETFLSSEEEKQVYGEVAVDADGYISVTNERDSTIEVYDMQKKLKTVVNRPGRFAGQLIFPFRLSLLPDGRMIITDDIAKEGGEQNNRLQIF